MVTERHEPPINNSALIAARIDVFGCPQRRPQGWSRAGGWISY